MEMAYFTCPNDKHFQDIRKIVSINNSKFRINFPVILPTLDP